MSETQIGLMFSMNEKTKNIPTPVLYCKPVDSWISCGLTLASYRLYIFWIKKYAMNFVVLANFERKRSKNVSNRINLFIMYY